jgi:hypothetical protein
VRKVPVGILTFSLLRVSSGYEKMKAYSAETEAQMRIFFLKQPAGKRPLSVCRR